MNYFKNLKDLLKTEWEEDKKQYLKLTENSPVAVRRAEGLTWYPVAIRGSEPGRGDYLTIELERTTHQDITHQFRFGMPVMFFSNHDSSNDKVEGVISFAGGNRLKVSLRTDEMPDWARDGKLGVDLLFDDNSYDEMMDALREAEKKHSEPEGHLIRILTGEKSPGFDDNIPDIATGRLNSSQKQAVSKIVSAKELAIVHGPPGTGKTTTLVQAIAELVRRDGEQVLVTAPSNTAVDLLSEKLSEAGLNVVRTGNPIRVSERLSQLTLDRKTADHPYSKEIKKLRKQASEYKNMAHKYKRSFGKAEREQRKALFDEAYKIMKEVTNTEQYIVDDILSKAQVITATPVGSDHFSIRERRYHTVVIDEAGQALEPACWIPILKAEKLILAGDHLQLPPTIKSTEASGLNTTLLEKCVALHPEAVCLLEEQYRMNSDIQGYSSKVFYQGKLRAHLSVASGVLFPDDSPLKFIDTAGCAFDEQQDGTSCINPEEAAFLVKQLLALSTDLKSHYKIENFPSIAVISPYKQQVMLLRDMISQTEALQEVLHAITVNTIDSFQGQERDAVFISMTRSNAEGEIGFLRDIRRMNVAMTRARKKLVVIGDSATLSTLPYYAGFISYSDDLGAYQSAWELMD